MGISTRRTAYLFILALAGVWALVGGEVSGHFRKYFFSGNTNCKLQLRFLVVILLLLNSFTANTQTTNIATWNFEDTDPYADAGVYAGVSQIVTNSSGTVQYLLGAPNTGHSIWNTGWNGGNGNKYWQIELDFTEYTGIVLSSKQKSSPTGPKNFKVQYRIGAGLWFDVPGGEVVCADDNFVSGTITNLALPAACNNQPMVYLRWLMSSDTPVSAGLSVSSAGSSRIDNIIVTGLIACAAPTIPSSGVSSTNIGQNFLSLIWNNGNGGGRIVIINTQNVFAPPTNGIDPIANPVYGGSGQQVVYNGNGNSVNITGLTFTTTYYFRVYEYNCSGTNIIFNPTPASNNFTTTDYSCTPTLTTIAIQGGEIGDSWGFSGGIVNTQESNSGTHSIRVGRSGESNTFLLHNINISCYSDVKLQLNHKVVSGSGPGMDAGEGAFIDVQLNNSGTWITIASVSGYNDAAWDWNQLGGTTNFYNSGCPGLTATNPVIYAPVGSPSGIQVRIWSQRKTGSNCLDPTQPPVLYSGIDEGFYVDDITLKGIIICGPTITIQPSNQEVCEGSNATFSVTATQTGTGPLSYAWEVYNGFLWTPTGSNSNSLTVTAAMALNGYRYRCTVSNGCGVPAVSLEALLTVNIVAVAPTSATVDRSDFCADDNGTVTLTASGGKGNEVQWFTESCGGLLLDTGTPLVTSSPSVTTTYYARWISDCGISSCASVTVNVKPLPVVSTTVDAQTVCNNSPTTAIVFSSSVSGTTYNWSNNNTSIGLAASGSTNNIPSFTATNLTGSPVTATITITPTAAGCIGDSYNITITVNPSPTAAITASGPTTFCQGGSVVLTSSAGSSYLWNTGATTQSITVTTSGSYTVIVTDANGCSATSAPVVVTVNSLPIAAITAEGPTTFCQGGSVVLTSSSGSSYLWSTGANTQSITVTTSGSYSVTVTDANGCTATSAATVVTVTPSPTLTGAIQAATVCDGFAATINLTGLLPNSIFSIEYSINSLPQVPITGLLANSAGNASFTTPVLTYANNGQTLQITLITITGSVPNCQQAFAQNVTLAVNPIPVLNVPGNQEVCNGALTTTISFIGTNATSYLWTNTNVSIGLAASGTATSPLFQIPAFTALNSGTVPVIATITVTPRYTGGGIWCNGSPESFTITVNPSTAVTATPPSQSICSGGTTNIALTSNVASSVTYTWTAVQQTGTATFNPSGSGSPIAEVIVNNSATPATVRYIITATANGCPGPQKTVDVIVNPNILVTYSPSQPITICTGTSTGITLNSNITGTTYSWTASLISGTATGFSNGSGASINQTLTNNTGADAVVRYTVSGSANTCPSGTVDIDVIVHPAPSVTSQLIADMCSDTPLGVNLNASTNGVAASSYNIISISSPGLTASAGSPAPGTVGANGLADDAWTNITGANVSVVYTIAPVSALGCIGPQFTVTVVIKPEPVANNASITICSRAILNYNLVSQVTSGAAGVKFTYTVVSSNPLAVPNGVPAEPNRTIPSAANITYNYINQTGSPVIISYTVTPSGLNGCTGNTFVLTITINPEPVGSSNPQSPFDLCNNSNTNIQLLSNVPGTTFTWTAVRTAGNVTGFGPGSGTVISQVLSVPFLGNGTVVYTVTPTSPLGCVGLQFSIQVSVDYTFPINMTVTGAPNPTTVCPDQVINLNLASNNTLAYLTRFNWINDNPSIGLISGGPQPIPAAGNWSFGGNVTYIISFTAANITSIPQTAHISITADAYRRIGTGFLGLQPPYSLGGYQCTGETENITITVNPTPTVIPVSNQVTCAGFLYTPSPFETTVPGTIFTWSYTGPNIGLTPAGGNGNIPAFTAVNAGTTDIVANFTVTTTYTNGGVTCNGNSEPFTITVKPSPVAPTITGNNAICYGATTILTALSATPGVAYRWYDAATGGTLLSNLNVFTTPALYTNTTYYVASYLSASGCESPRTAVTITVQSVLNPGSISANQTICWNGDPALFTSVAATGSGISYQWQAAVGPAWTFNNIAINGTNETYDPPAGLTQTTWYQRLAYSDAGGVVCTSDPSNIIIITVQNEINSGSIGVDEILCPGGNPNVINSILPGSGGTGSLSYLWQYSLDGISFLDIVPAETGLTYDPPAGIMQTTWFRRIAVYELNGVSCQSTPSNAIEVTVDDIEDPQIMSCADDRVIDGCSTADITGPAFSTNVVTSSYAEFNNATNQGFATDNCWISAVTYQDVASGNCPIVVTRTWTVIDGAGNFDTCPQLITVEDPTPPTITACPTFEPICQVASNIYTIPLLVASDDCTGTLVITFEVTGVTTRSGSGNNASGFFNTGASTITWTVNDACNNTSFCTTQVTINPVPTTSAIYHQ